MWRSWTRQDSNSGEYRLAAPGVGARSAPRSPTWPAIVVAGITIVPLLFVIIGGFRTNAQINAHPAGLPHPWVLANYRAIVTSRAFWQFLANSALSR